MQLADPSFEDVLKFFAGLTEEEIANLLGVSDRTVRRRWVFARAWLFQQLDALQGGNRDA